MTAVPGDPRPSGAQAGPPRPEEFDAFYAGRPPWEVGHPQAAIVALADEGLLQGRVLDAGCGTGEHALLAAARGLAALGVDLSARAIDQARAKAAGRGLDARFEVADAFALGALGEKFNTVVDTGLFHVFDDADRPRYIESLRAVMGPGARLLLLSFSDAHPGTAGPRRVSRAELEAAFAAGFTIERLEPSTFEYTLDPAGGRAWCAVIVRRG
jgi:cyclopropane fatty-acyl-phospholipid synthase-like methyltransferase